MARIRWRAFIFVKYAMDTPSRRASAESEIATFARERHIFSFIRYSEIASLILLLLGEPSGGDGPLRPKVLQAAVRSFIRDLPDYDNAAVASNTRDDQNFCSVRFLPATIYHYCHVTITDAFIQSCMGIANMRAITPRVDALAVDAAIIALPLRRVPPGTADALVPHGPATAATTEARVPRVDFAAQYVDFTREELVDSLVLRNYRVAELEDEKRLLLKRVAAAEKVRRSANSRFDALRANMALVLDHIQLRKGLRVVNLQGLIINI